MKLITFTITMEEGYSGYLTPDAILVALSETLTERLGITQFTLECTINEPATYADDFEVTVTSDVPEPELPPWEFRDFEEDHSFDDDLFDGDTDEIGDR